MAKNPMQRKIKNSVIIAVLITILITGVIIVALFLMLSNKNKEEKERLSRLQNIYVLNSNVYSGQIITADMLTMKQFDKETIPNNAITTLSDFENAILEGTANGATYDIYSDEQGLYLQVDTRKAYLTYHEDTDKYTVKSNGSDIEVTINTPTVIAKVDLKKNSILTPALITKSNEQLTDDQRVQEYNMIVLPTNLEAEQYIDIRLTFPNGQDYIVVSKKRVIDATQDTVWIKLSEEEILTMSNAIVEAFTATGSKLYATTYVEPGNQTVATPTYPVKREVLDLINTDPNVVTVARNALWARYNASNGDQHRNNDINSQLNQYGSQTLTNIETKVQESIRKQQEARQSYLDELNGD